MNKIYVLLFILAISFAVSADEILFTSKEITARVKEIIENSDESILLLTEVASGKELVSILNEKAKSGVRVSVIVSSSSLEKKYSLHKSLFAEGTEVFTLKTKAAINSSLLISDGKVILAGSFPFSDEKYFGYDFCILSEEKTIVDSSISYFTKLKSKSDLFEQVDDTLFFDSIAFELKKYTDKELFIRGFVNDVSKSPKSETYFLKMKSGKVVMTIVFFESFVKQLEKKSVNPMYFKGREILINGILINHEKYGFEILPSDISQIKIFTD
ncbi:MAG: phospholipase D-like domain-containing protein [bacterium]